MSNYQTATMWVIPCVLTVALLTACGQQADAQGPEYADVISATPIRTTVNHPRQECHTETVTVREPVQDQHQVLGTALGAVVGGVIGNQIGSGRGKKLATVAGAVAGGYAGHEVQQRRQDNATHTVNKQVCETVNDQTTKIVGYRVKYKYKGAVHSARMDHDPGARVEVKPSVSVIGGAK